MWVLGRGKQLNLVRQHVSGKRAQHNMLSYSYRKYPQDTVLKIKKNQA
jgi:hypothetical protein